MMKKIFLIVLTIVIMISFSSTGYAATVVESPTINDEKFVEYNAVTGQETVFTLNDVIDGTNSLENVMQVQARNGTTYTLPYDPITHYDTGITDDMSRKPIDGSELNEVTNVNASPYCKTVLILAIFKKEDGSMIYSPGTGAMVGNKVLLTAGHVVYHTNYKINPVEIRVLLRYSNEKNSATDLANETDYYHPERWVFSANYRPEIDTNYDWCYLTMFDDIGKTYTGWFGIGTTSGDIVGDSINVTGYPNVSGKRFRQFASSGIMDSTSEYRVRHTCSTYGGHSGAPLYSSSYVIWAVHTSGGNSYNYGVRLTSTLYNLLVNRINETN